VEGPSKADIQCDSNPDGTCQVKYIPTEPGNYVVNIKFADEHIKGASTIAWLNTEIVIALKYLRCLVLPHVWLARRKQGISYVDHECDTQTNGRADEQNYCKLVNK